MILRKLFLPCTLLVFFSSFFVASARGQKAAGPNDISIDGFAQFTSTASGNGITARPTQSAGGAASFRHSYHWWLGYEAGYEYTRFGDNYTGQVYGIQHNMHEFSGSYFVHGHKAFGIEPFATAGISAVVFSPSLNGGQNVPWQARPGINFGAGVNYPLLTGHFGLRLQYRGVYYKTPDFGRAALTTDAYRLTSEPMAGVYFRF